MYQRNAEEWVNICSRGIKNGHLAEDPAATYYQAQHMPATFLVPPNPGDRVLDLGCGNGRLAIGLLGYDVHYIGLDPVPDCIRFCQDAFAPWDNYRFEHIPLRTATYTPSQTIAPIDWTIPLPDNSIDWAAAISVFTHMETEPVAIHYAEEMRRVLRPSGVLWTTWFRCPPNKPTSIVERTAYREAFIVNTLRDMEWLATAGGLGTDTHNQWQVFTRKL